MTVAHRLMEALQAVCPIVSVRITGPSSGAYQADTDATAPQIAAADIALASFDWSQAAHDTWERAKEPNLRDLLDQADAAISAIDTYLTIADGATNQQVRAEVKAIDQRQRRIIQALKRLITREWRN